MSLEARGPNAEQITYWGQTGPKWVTLESLLDAQIGPVGLALMERAGVSAGERVLDVGCGCGQTCLQLAERVGAGGSVLGIDVSTPMLERARSRVREAGHGHVSLENADAQTFAFDPGSVDLVFSRFGIMFFSEPGSAFANLRRALAPGGRVAFACWQALDRNPWMLVPLRAAATHIALPARPEPGAPGPFSLADEERLRGILEAAGFSDVVLESHEPEMVVGGEAGVEGAVDFLLQMGPVGAALREAGEAGEALLPKVRAALREAVAPYAADDVLRMSAAAWFVIAR